MDSSKAPCMEGTGCLGGDMSAAVSWMSSASVSDVSEL
jgi:hypothetical protein